MAGLLINFIYLTATILIFGGAVAAILFVVNKISTFTSTTKEKLKLKGYDVSHQGVAVQTQKRFNREDYVDATQRVGEGVWGVVIWESKERGFWVSIKQITSGLLPFEVEALTHLLKLQTNEPEHTVKKSRSGLLRRKDNDPN